VARRGRVRPPRGGVHPRLPGDTRSCSSTDLPHRRACLDRGWRRSPGPVVLAPRAANLACRLGDVDPWDRGRLVTRPVHVRPACSLGSGSGHVHGALHSARSCSGGGHGSRNRVQDSVYTRRRARLLFTHRSDQILMAWWIRGFLTLKSRPAPAPRCKSLIPHGKCSARDGYGETHQAKCASGVLSPRRRHPSARRPRNRGAAARRADAPDGRRDSQKPADRHRRLHPQLAQVRDEVGKQVAESLKGLLAA
jgi:hypothetical protein